MSKSSREVPGGGWDRLRLYFSVKLALAAALALLGANLLALEKPAWSITTVIMLSLPVFVGAVGEKAFFRSIGTVCGGLIGVFLVGNFAADGFLFLAMTFGVICFCVFFNAGQRSPYAFFLTALTLVVVAAGSYQQPDHAWELAVSRVEEILLGVFSSLAATALLWPRFAREDFRAEAENGLGELLALQRLILEKDPQPIASQPEAAVTARAARLRQLIQMGGRESLYFRARLEVLQDFVATYVALAQTLLEIAALREKNPNLQNLLADEREIYWQTWRELIDAARQRRPVNEEAMPRFNGLAAKLRERIDDISDDLSATPPEERMARSAMFLLSLDTVENTQHLLEVWEELQSDLTMTTSRRQTVRPRRVPFSPIGFFGLRNGIRSGLATVAAFLFADWLQPPGGGLIPVIAFIFTCSSRTFLDAKGDTGMFTNLIWVAFVSIPWFFFVFLIAPFLTNYLWVNCFLGGVLFLFGWWIYPGLPGLSYRGFAVLNALLATFALDFQQPVAFGMVSDNYFGLILGVTFAAVFQRAFWPILPQQEFRQNLLKALGDLSAVLQQPIRSGTFEGSLKKKPEAAAPTKEAIIASLSEARKWSTALPNKSPRALHAIFNEEENQQREASLYLLQRLIRVVFRLSELAKKLPDWPEAEAVLAPRLRDLQKRAAADLTQLAQWWSTGQQPVLTCPPQLVPEVLWPLAQELPALSARSQLDEPALHAWMALLIREKTLIERVVEFSEATLKLSPPLYMRDEIL